MIKQLNGVENNQHETEHGMEVFTDADWGGNGVSRKSTSATIMFIDGVMIYSHSRSQKSVALSSCESELLSITGALLRQAWIFLTGRANGFIIGSTVAGLFGPWRVETLLRFFGYRTKSRTKSWTSNQFNKAQCFRPQYEENVTTKKSFHPVFSEGSESDAW